MHFLPRLARNVRAGTAIEYGLITALVALAALGAAQMPDERAGPKPSARTVTHPVSAHATRASAHP